MKNIMILVPRLAGGGQERISAITANLLLSDFHVTLVIFSDDSIVFKTNAPIINLNVPSKSNSFSKVIQQIKRIIKLHKVNRKIKPDLIYSIGNTANLTNVLTFGRHTKITSIRAYANISKNIVDCYVYKNSDYITCISEGLESKLNSIYPFTKIKSRTLYNGIDIVGVKSLSNEEVSLDLLESNRKRIVAVGRLTDVKGFRQLIKSFAEVLKINNCVDLLIIGEGNNLADLENLAFELRIRDHVKFLGFKENVYNIMKNCDIFVLSSIHEGFGNVVVEAMACELPVIVTSCLSGPAEIIGSDSYEIEKITYFEYGIMVPTFENDFSNERKKTMFLANAILKVLNNSDLAIHYSKKSKQRAKDFSIVRYKHELLKLMEDVFSS